MEQSHDGGGGRQGRLTLDSIMNPTPSKRRRSSSPGGPGQPQLRRSASPVTARSPATTVRHPTASPSHPILPPPLPSSSHGPPPPSSSGGHPFPPFAGPSNWASGWSSSRPHNVRHSMDMRSPTPVSPKDEDEVPGMIFTRDTGSRAPRSMMACTRCRRQKMKCDGPTQVPCRGCRQAGQPCIFEARSRPKSISSLPSRTPLYTGTMQGQPGRPGTPSGGPGGFYPSGPQPAPPVTSRPPPEYALRQAREPMPPPPQASLTVLTSAPYSSHRPHSPPPIPGPPVVLQPLAPPPSQAAQYTPLPPPTASSTQSHDARIRQLESSVHLLSSVPTTLNALQMAMSNLQRSLDSIATGNTPSSATAPRPPRPLNRARVVHAEIPDTVWENYRTRSWPLTPWLVGLRDAQGLPSLVVNLLGKRPLVDRGEISRRECDEALSAVTSEIGALIGQPTEWTREEIRSLGVYATWLNDTALAALTVGLARRQEHDRMLLRKSQDDWREWIYVFILDHMIHLADFAAPISSGSLANPWRDRLSTSVPGDPAVRDRDLKLLAWLEYAEMMRDIYEIQLSARSPAAAAAAEAEDETMSVSDRGAERPLPEREPKAPPGSAGAQSASDETASDRKKIMELWRKYSPRWEAWAAGWSAKGDPVLSIYHHYAVLYTSSPSFMASSTVWTELSQSHDGFTQLERTRDAAFALIQALCSPEIGRTLVYSFALYRPLLGLALHTVLCILTSLPNSPLISLSHVTYVLRSTHEAIANARPLDMAPGPSGRPTTSLLAELAEGGSGVVVAGAKRELLGVELSATLWKRLLG